VQSSLSRDPDHVTVWASTVPTREFEQLFEPNAAAYESGHLPIDAFAAAIGTRYDVEFHHKQLPPGHTRFL
jgi:hypothetical protein